MMENDTQNSQQAASTALHNAPKLAKIAQAGVQGGPAGAATEAAVQYCKKYWSLPLQSCCCRFWFCSCCPVRFSVR